MTNVIRFLETMASNALVARASYDEYIELVSGINGEPRCIDALVAKNADSLGSALDAEHKLMCVVFAPDDESETDSPEQEEEPGDGAQQEE